MNKSKILALLCAVWVAFLPSLALAQAATQGNNGSPTANGGVRVLGTDGTSDRLPLMDNSGRLDVLSGYPSMDVLNHLSNRTLAAAASDSSVVPFVTAGYRQMYALLRMKASSFGAAPISVQIAIRSCASAQQDSTQLGWWFPLGKSAKYGKTLPMLDLNDRWKMIPLTDSITFTPYQALYSSVYFTNLTGAQAIYDLWILGVR